MLKNLSYSILLFLFIFSFPIINGINSSHIAAVIAIIAMILSKKSFYYLKIILQKKITIIILFFYIIMVLYSALNTTLLGQYDYTMLKTIFNNIFSYVFCLIIVSIFFSSFYENAQIEKNLSITLILQSIIIIIMLISPDIRIFIQNYIRTGDEMERMAAYDGVRGLGLSGSIAFGLAITMGLLSYIFILWLSFMYHGPIVNKILLFTIVIIASLSAGRTSILAFAFGLIYIITQSKHLHLIKNIIKYIIIFSVTISILLFLSNNSNIEATVNRYIEYAFQPLINYIDTGSFSVSSTERLSEMYFIPEEASTVFIGDGRYSADDGTYYMNTDSGYLRFMLYFGLLGSIIPYSAFLIFCLYVANTAKKINPSLGYYFGFIILMSFIFHYKAEVLFYNVSYMKIIYILGFFYIIKESNIRSLK